jgi:hypothetical protein
MPASMEKFTDLGTAMPSHANGRAHLRVFWSMAAANVSPALVALECKVETGCNTPTYASMDDANLRSRCSEQGFITGWMN